MAAETEQEFQERLENLRRQEEEANQRRALAALPMLVHTWVLPGSRGHYRGQDTIGKSFNYDYAQEAPAITFGDIIYTGVFSVFRNFIPNPLPARFTSFSEASTSAPVPATPQVRHSAQVPQDRFANDPYPAGKSFLESLIAQSPAPVAEHAPIHRPEKSPELTARAAEVLSGALKNSQDELAKKTADFNALLASFKKLSSEKDSWQRANPTGNYSNEVSEFSKRLAALTEEIEAIKKAATGAVPLSIYDVMYPQVKDISQVPQPAPTKPVSVFTAQDVADIVRFCRTLEQIYGFWDLTYNNFIQATDLNFNMTLRELGSVQAQLSPGVFKAYIAKCKTTGNGIPSDRVLGFTVNDVNYIYPWDRLSAPVISLAAAKTIMEKLKSPKATTADINSFWEQVRDPKNNPSSSFRAASFYLQKNL